MNPELERVEASLPDLRPDQRFELIIALDGPVPGPVDFALESSDARLVAVPRTVRFAKGEREKVIPLRTARTVTRGKAVTIRVHTVGKKGPSKETLLQVRSGQKARRSR